MAPFIWTQMVKRNRGWYAHDEKGVLQRDPKTQRWSVRPPVAQLRSI